MTSALLVGAAPVAGADAFYADLAAGHDLVIAADAAAEWLVDLGVTPGLALGDFDSARPGAVDRLRGRGIPIRAFSAAKDETDLELAVAAARELGADRLTVTAAFTCRLDHTLAAVGLVARAADLDAEIREPELTGWVLAGDHRGTLELALERGSLVTVMAVLGPARGVTLTGVRFPLADADLAPMSGLGVSNVVERKPATVTVADGTLLVLAPRAAGM